MKQGYTYELLTQYKDFSGSFVEHCHILDHEDRGMMEKVTIDAPGVAARTGAANEDKDRVSAIVPGKPGKPSVLLFVRGAFCQHCMTQLTEMATKLSSRNLAVSVISASTEEDLRDFPPVPFTLVADPKSEDIPGVRST